MANWCLNKKPCSDKALISKAENRRPDEKMILPNNVVRKERPLILTRICNLHANKRGESARITFLIN
ncbi:MAG TPA: hypothetical protein DCY53_10895 [Desulfobacteraceae bacterium]|nr:hypothetical protein [Desulfobacteraceae bacterium]